MKTNLGFRRNPKSGFQDNAKIKVRLGGNWD